MTVPLLQTALPAPRLELTSGTVEGVKWCALSAMVVDHVAAVFYGRDAGMLVEAIGRLAFPLFAIVLGYNLHRSADVWKLAKRLAIVGAIAFPFHAYLFAQAGGWFPLNVLLTFAVAAVVIGLIQAGQVKPAFAVFLLGGSLVEYWWPGVGLVVATWATVRYRSRWAVLALCAALAGLCALNGNAWALLSLPALSGLAALDLRVPRARWAFWVAYPAHLAALAVLAS